MAPSILPSPATDEKDVEKINVITAGWTDELTFWVNGTKIHLEQADPECTLLEYLRGIGLTGTKLGCAEGGCGACTVVVSQFNPTTGKIYHASVNACLAPLVSVDGKHVITGESAKLGLRVDIDETVSRGNWKCKETSPCSTENRTCKRQP